MTSSFQSNVPFRHNKYEKRKCTEQRGKEQIKNNGTEEKENKCFSISFKYSMLRVVFGGKYSNSVVMH